MWWLFFWSSILSIQQSFNSRHFFASVRGLCDNEMFLDIHFLFIFFIHCMLKLKILLTLFRIPFYEIYCLVPTHEIWWNLLKLCLLFRFPHRLNPGPESHWLPSILDATTKLWPWFVNSGCSLMNTLSMPLELFRI